MSDSILRAQSVDFSYYDGLILYNITLELKGGDLVALIGPNGSGKTTLLKVLSGILTPKVGYVNLGGRDLQRMDRRLIAQHIAVVPQELDIFFSFTVWEMVMMGRTPYVRPLLGAGEGDREVVERVMGQVGIEHLAQRPFLELSGGERQKVIVAMALAQEPEVLLLDEPTVHLDINHQLEVLELIRALNRGSGLTVLAAMHDLNLTALYFDRLVLLDGGRIIAEGTPREVLQQANIDRVFKAKVELHDHPTRRVPQVILMPPS